MKKQITLAEYLKHYGYSKEEWEATVKELEEHGIAKGCFQNYSLLGLVLTWLLNYESSIEIKSEANND